MGGPSFLQYNIKLMKTACMWPLDTKSSTVKILYTVYGVTMVVSLALVSVGQLIEIFVSPDITSMASAVDLATLTASGLFKMVYIIFYNKHFQELVAKIDTNFEETDFSDRTFSMAKWLKNSKLYTTVYVMSSTVCLLGFFVGLPLLASYIPFLSSRPLDKVQPSDLIGPQVSFSAVVNLSKSTTLDKNELDMTVTGASSKEKFFPLKCWLPFDVSWSPLYELVILLEVYPLLGSGHLYLVSDSFFFTIIYISCGQLEILKISLRGLREKYRTLAYEKEAALKKSALNTDGRLSPIVWDLYLREKEMETKLNNELKNCIHFHVKIIEVIRGLDVLLRSMIVVDFLHAVISLSFALLQTATANAIYEWMQMFVFIWICILHQFLNNYFADTLNHQQESVAEVVYEIPWVEGTSTMRTAVSVTTRQARHFTRLSGWKMYMLGLPTFVEFMRLLVSYFLVLQSLQADELQERKNNRNV